MAEVNLAQALKLKNRLTKKVSAIQTTIQANNQSTVGATRLGNIRELYAELETQIEHLVAVKAAISRANEPIQALIFRLAEVRGQISFVSRIPVNDGPTQNYMGGTTVQEVELDQAWQMAETERLELMADALQDELDAFNATAKVTIPD